MIAVIEAEAPAAAPAAAGCSDNAGGRRARWARAAGCADARLFWRYAWIVIGAAVIFAVGYSLLSWLHYRTYYGGRYDLGNMVQAVYNTAHGHFLEITNANGAQMSRLGAHVDPIIAFFALPWLVWPNPMMLLVGQAIIVALAAWPAYRLGVRVLKDPGAAAILAGALLVYPALGFLVLAEFHPVSLAVPLLLFAFLYLEEERLWRALPFLVLAALCKEEIPLLIGLMGVFFAVRKRRWWPLSISAAAAVYFGLAIGVVLPHFNVKGSPFVGRYSEYGSSTGSIMRNVILHPVHTVRGLLAVDDLRYWWRLLWPFALTSLLSPLTLLISLPELLVNGLSKQLPQRRIEFQYVAGEIPFLFAAAVLGVRRLHGWLSRLHIGGRADRPGSASRADRPDPAARADRPGSVSRAARAALAGITPGGIWRRVVQVRSLALIVFIGALAGNYFLGPLPFSLPNARYSAANYGRDSHDAVLDRAVKIIPRNATVSVGNIVGSHLSARRVVYTFPYVGRAEYVIIDSKHPFVSDALSPGAFQISLSSVIISGHYRSIYARDGVYVFERRDLRQGVSQRAAAVTPPS